MQRLPIALALILTLAVPATLHAEEAGHSRLISLSGHGEVTRVPDLAYVTSGVVTQGTTAAEALKANTAAMVKVMDEIKAAGIAERDAQTSNFTVQPRYDYSNGNQAPKLLGYEVSNTVTVRIRRIAELGTLLDALVRAGSNQVNGISFDVEKPEAAADEARKLAAADATRKAKLLAQAMGVELGQVVAISENGSYPPPMPMARKLARADSVAAVPVAAGEQTIGVDVNITWEIR